MDDHKHLDPRELFWIMTERIRSGITQKDLVAAYGSLAVYCLFDDIRHGEDYSNYQPGATEALYSSIISKNFEKVKRRILLQ